MRVTSFPICIRVSIGIIISQYILYLFNDLSKASDHCEDSCLSHASILAAVRGMTSPCKRSVACRTYCCGGGCGGYSD